MGANTAAAAVAFLAHTIPYCCHIIHLIPSLPSAQGRQYCYSGVFLPSLMLGTWVGTVRLIVLSLAFGISNMPDDGDAAHGPVCCTVQLCGAAGGCGVHQT